MPSIIIVIYYFICVNLGLHSMIVFKNAYLIIVIFSTQTGSSAGILASLDLSNIGALMFEVYLTKAHSHVATKAELYCD